MTPRSIRASGPGPELETLRQAYLDLLKLALCDLVGSASTSVRGEPGGGVTHRELTGEQLASRADGRDWPLHGLTMTGLARLDDLQRCVESLVEDGIAGDLIETGSWRGGSSMLMRATLDTLGTADRTVVVADSFAGFPPPERPREYDASLGPYFSAFEFLTAPEDEVRASFERLGLGTGIELVAGFFEQTLPKLEGRTWALIRLDGDTYDATKVALNSLYPGLSSGGYLIVDDYGALEECREAVEDFRHDHDITEPLSEVDWTCVRWRRDVRPQT